MTREKNREESKKRARREMGIRPGVGSRKEDRGRVRERCDSEEVSWGTRGGQEA